MLGVTHIKIFSDVELILLEEFYKTLEVNFISYCTENVNINVADVCILI